MTDENNQHHQIVRGQSEPKPRPQKDYVGHQPTVMGRAQVIGTVASTALVGYGGHIWSSPLTQEEIEARVRHSIALNLLRGRVDISLIASSTGLSIEKVKQLQQQLNESAQS